MSDPLTEIHMNQNYIRLFTTTLFCGLLLNSLIAQDNQANHARYWYYRYRLINDFTIVGDCQGCSLPVPERNLGQSHQMKWGDGTINLGWYIGVLGTEYKLLKNSNQDVSQTVKELYYALKAFNRLDENAESYWRCATCPPNSQTGDLNGFFIRDDVPADFTSPVKQDAVVDESLSNYDHFNQGITSTSMVNNVESDFSHQLSQGKPPSEMSHDQVYHLLMGLALVNKFVDPDANYNGLPLNNVDGNTYILQESRNIVTRIVTYMKDHDNWVIKNPVTDSCLIDGNGYVNCGFNGTGNATLMSYGLAEAACFAANEVNPNPYDPSLSCDDFHNALSIADNESWQLAHAVTYPYSSEYYKILSMVAVGSSWRNLLGINISAFKLGEYINEWSLTMNDYHYLSLLHQVLHGGVNYIDDSRYTDLLNTAPCTGPYNYGNGHWDSYEWSSTNRLMYPDRRASNDLEPIDFPGEYPGLDYMLLHNLYYIIRDENDFNTNLIDIGGIADFPFGPVSMGPVGSQANPYEVDAFRFIYGDNILDTNAVVTYRAGKEIRLLPGFDVKPGADFHAYISPFTCQNGTYQRTAAGDSTSSDYGFSYPVAVSHPASKHNMPSTYQYPVPSPAPAPQVMHALDNISVHPNPSNGVFTITGMQEAPSEISVYDVHGKLVIHKMDIQGGEMSIDLTGYPTGVYAITIRSGNRISVKRAVVE